MGFYPATPQRSKSEKLQFADVSIEFLHEMQCRACPLNNQLGLKHPQMPATGSDAPVIYILGEAPGATEDEKGQQFIGKTGRMIRSRIPDRWYEKIRWNNVVRTRPPKNRTPTMPEVECCRPSVRADIEASKPEVIIGFGSTALHWLTGRTGITRWNGRRTPVRVGSHVCWFYPMLHPSYVARGVGGKSNPNELVFELDLKRVWNDLEAGLPEPFVEDDPVSGVDFVTGARGSKDLGIVLDWIHMLHDAKTIGVDYETRGIRPYEDGAKMLSLALASKQGALAFPLYHQQSGWTAEQVWKIEDAWIDLILHGKGKMIAHQLAFELEWTGYFYGTECVMTGRWEDSLAQSYILDERPNTHSLDFQVRQYFGFDVKALSPINRKAVWKSPVDEVLRYNAIDAKYHRLLGLQQTKRLQEEKLMGVYEHHLQRIPAVVMTQLQGVPVSQIVVQDFLQKYTAQIEEAEQQIADQPLIRKWSKQRLREFRPSATRDVSQFIESVTGRKPESVEENVLTKLDHPVTNLVLKWRTANKIRSTYVLPLCKGAPTMFRDGCLHPVLSTTKTRTWRTSSEDPNSQNFPKRKRKDIRSQIRPGRNEKVVSIDYASIQARNVAMESKDKALVKAFWDRYDIHADWTERIQKVAPEWIKEGGRELARDKALFKQYRDKTKNQYVFPSFFGARPASVAGYLGIDEGKAEGLQQDFWRMFPDILGWHQRLQRNYRKTGYVTGLSGFRRRAPISPNQLINAPIQADESKIVLDAMVRVVDAGYVPCMEIHDDLTFIWHKNDIERNLSEVVPIMLQTPFKWAHIVPIGVEVSVGDDWGSTKEIGAYFSDLWNGDLTLKHDDPYIGSWASGEGWAEDD